MIDPAIIAELEARQRELLSVFLTESDPAQWPAGDSREDRGDRVWMKKDAQVTINLIETIRRVLGREEFDPQKQVLDLKAEDAVIKEAEARAARMTDRSGPQIPH